MRAKLAALLVATALVAQPLAADGTARAYSPASPIESPPADGHQAKRSKPIRSGSIRVSKRTAKAGKKVKVTGELGPRTKHLVKVYRIPTYRGKQVHKVRTDARGKFKIRLKVPAGDSKARFFAMYTEGKKVYQTRFVGVKVVGDGPTGAVRNLLTTDSYAELRELDLVGPNETISSYQDYRSQTYNSCLLDLATSTPICEPDRLRYFSHGSDSSVTGVKDPSSTDTWNLQLHDRFDRSDPPIAIDASVEGVQVSTNGAVVVYKKPGPQPLGRIDLWKRASGVSVAVEDNDPLTRTVIIQDMTADGRYLLYSVGPGFFDNRMYAPRELIRYDTETGQRTVVYSVPDDGSAHASATISDDGQSVAFQADSRSFNKAHGCKPKHPISETAWLWRGGNYTMLSECDFGTTTYDPVISGNGRCVVMTSDNPYFGGMDVERDQDLVLLDLATGSAARLTDIPWPKNSQYGTSISDLSIASDGSTVLFAYNSGLRSTLAVWTPS